MVRGLLASVLTLLRVAGKAARHLAITTERLFTAPFMPERVAELEDTPDIAERVNAFVSRFGRLQDTLGDKLLSVLLTALGEKTSAAIDNLDRAERLGLVYRLVNSPHIFWLG